MKPLLRDEFPEEDGPSVFNVAGFLTGRYALNPHLRLLAEVPFSRWKFDDNSGGVVQDAHLTVGNVYLGVEGHFASAGRMRHTFVEVGLRLPTMPEPDFPDQLGYTTGLLAALDRQDAFQDDYLPIQALGNVVFSTDPTFSFRLRGGPSYWIYTGEDNPFFERESELFLLYSAQAWFTSPFVTGAFGVTGRYQATAEDGDFFDNSIHQLTAQVTKDFDGFLLGGFIRAPMDRTYGRIVTVVYGLSLMY